MNTQGFHWTPVWFVFRSEVGQQVFEFSQVPWNVLCVPCDRRIEHVHIRKSPLIFLSTFGERALLDPAEYFPKTVFWGEEKTVAARGKWDVQELIQRKTESEETEPMSKSVKIGGRHNQLRNC